MKAAVGFSSQVETAMAVEEALRSVVVGLQGQPDLVFLFATSDHAEEIRRASVRISTRLGAPAILGGSTTGVITAEGEHESGAGLGLLAIQGVRAGAMVAGSIAELGHFLSAVPEGALAIALPDPRRQDVRTFDRLRESRSMLVGAGVSGRGESLFGVAGTSAGEGQVPLAWIEGAAVSIGVTQGATAATPFHKITRSRSRAVLELDGRPAAQAFGDFVQGQQLASPDELPGLLLAIVRHDATGAELVRPIVGLDARAGALLFQQTIPPDCHLAFAWRDTIGAHHDRERMLSKLVANLPGPAVAALYFNCQGRGSTLFLEPDSDAIAIRKALPNVPLLGMSSSFEVGPVGPHPELLMYSGVLAVLSATK